MLCINKLLKNHPKVLQEIRFHVTLRAELPNAPPCESIIQLLFSGDIFLLQCAHKQFILFLAALGFTFNNIRTFISYEFRLNTPLLGACFKIFPELRVIKMRVHSDAETLQLLRINGKNLEEIVLPNMNTKVLDADDLCKVFFRDATIAKVEKKFAAGQTMKLSFPNLKRMCVPFELPSMLRIFKMLVLSYTDCEIEWLPEFDDFPVSTFDGVLCPAIGLYPDHAMRMCDLRFNDLKFDYVLDTLTSWRNLRFIRFIIGRSNANVNLSVAEKRLRSIFCACPNLQKFELILMTNAIDNSFVSTMSVLQKCGGQFKDVCITDPYRVLSHKDIVAFVNCFPNVETLHLRCKPTSRYYKDAKISLLSHLTNFRYSFMIEHNHNKIKVSTSMVNDIIKAGPNIEELTIPMDDEFFTMLNKCKLSAKMRTLNCMIFPCNCADGQASVLKSSRNCNCCYDLTESIARFVRTTYLEEVSVTNDNYYKSIDIRRFLRNDFYPQPMLHYKLLPHNVHGRYYTGDFCVDI